MYDEDDYPVLAEIRLVLYFDADHGALLEVFAGDEDGECMPNSIQALGMLDLAKDEFR